MIGLLWAFVLAEFPSRDLDEPLTKEFLRAELADFRAEMAEFEARMNDKFRQRTIWMCTLSTTLVGIGALVS